MTTSPHVASSRLAVAVIGYTGGVGSRLLKAMDQIGVRPVALVRSSTMEIVECGPDGNATEQGKTKTIPTDYQVLADTLLAWKQQQPDQPNHPPKIPVIADVTASSTLQSKYYATWLRAGIHVVAANKGIFAGPAASYQELLDAAASGRARLLHETTVGAGLPVLGTLQGLVASSHEIVTIEGILSGTLAYVLGQVAGGKTTLSQAVTQAKALGYTEPDPRDDLNGMDVARKAVILARLAGIPPAQVELSNMTIESLVPAALQDVTVDDFLARLAEFDSNMAQRVANTEAAGGLLHYAAKINVREQTVQVGLLSCDASHPFNHAGPDNMIAITTNYYKDRPLVIQGAGAGGDVTATGVLADILQCLYQP